MKENNKQPHPFLRFIIFPRNICGKVSFRKLIPQGSKQLLPQNIIPVYSIICSTHRTFHFLKSLSMTLFTMIDPSAH